MRKAANPERDAPRLFGFQISFGFRISDFGFFRSLLTTALRLY